MGKRSNSSLALRNELARNYTVPEIATFVKIERYYGAARRLHDQSIRAVIAGDLVLSYKYLHNLITLLNDRIPTHPSYTKHNPNRAWGCRTTKQCIELLEQVVERMDQQQDEINKKAEEDMLIDLFDGEVIGSTRSNNTTYTTNPRILLPITSPIAVPSLDPIRIDTETEGMYIEATEEKELQPSELLYPPIPTYSSTVQNKYDR